MPWEPLRDSTPPDPVPVQASLDRLFANLGAPSGAVVGDVFTGWQEIVGATVAEHVRPLSMREGVLTVSVDDPAWATQIRLLQGDLIARIQAAVPGSDVVSLEVRVRRR